VARGNQTLTYQIRPVRRSQIGRLSWIGDDRQEGLIRSWLDSDFHPTREQKFPLDVYSNFHGPDTVIRGADRHR
jgi:hypothetical protein